MADQSVSAAALLQKLEKGSVELFAQFEQSPPVHSSSDRPAANFLNDETLRKLITFVELVNKWNRVYNLTAVRLIEDMVGRHLLDSLSVLPYLPSKSRFELPAQAESSAPVSVDETDVLDVGTGAGLPVIPIALARPDLQFVSVESNGKKTRFQQQALIELDIKNVRVVNERIENVSTRAAFVLSRAFTEPNEFLKVAASRCLPDAHVVIMLGQKEAMPAELPGGFKLLECREIAVPEVDSQRHIAACTF